MNSTNQNRNSASEYVAPAIESSLSSEQLRREVHYAGNGLTEVPELPVPR